MGVKENIKDWMYLKKTIHKPIAVKEFEKENNQLRDLINLSERVKNRTKKAQILQDIKLLRYGLEGEQNVYFELMNSFVPMLILHDVRLEFDDYTAQMDFIVITYKHIIILETKKLNGDIEINADGDFIRSFKSNSGKIYKKEGVYSPVSQNERHVKILQKVLMRAELVNKFYSFKSAVIMANPKSIINKDKCPKNIKENLYKHDQLANFMQKSVKEKVELGRMDDRRIHKIAAFLKENHKPANYDYMARYGLKEEDLTPVANKLSDEEIESLMLELESSYAEYYMTASEEKTVMEESWKDEDLTVGSDNKDVRKTDLYKKLKEYRLNKSRKEEIPAYAVFTNAELEEMVKVRPIDIKALYDIKTFSKRKTEMYGEDILRIIKEDK